MLNRRNLPLSSLRAFESVGHRLHMGKAGEDLGVTHGAISHHIRALEAQLEVKLFTREKNSLQLTDAGKLLLKAVTQGFNKIIDGTQHLDADNLSGKLTIGCTQTAGANWIAKIISEFIQRYPQINIHTVEIKPQQQEIAREIDIAICYGRPNNKNRVIEELASLDVFPVCSPRLFEGQNPIKKTADLTNFTLLHEGINNWSRWFEAMNATKPKNTKEIHFFSTNLTLNAARDGYGIALCNHLEVQQDLKDGGLVKLLGKTIPELDSYFLVTDEPDIKSLRTQLFEAWIKEIFKKDGIINKSK